MATATVAKPAQAMRRQRPSISTRLTNKANLNGEEDENNTRPFKEPFVRDDDYILKKFRGRKASLIVHLHPTFFRFDQQEGTFSYKSEMRTFIEHLQKQTVPHEMIDEFLKAGVQFYDGCLIIEVHNHRTQEVKAMKKSEESKPGAESPFSLHKYNEHITPSPYAPFPNKSEEPPSKKRRTSEAEETEKEKKDKQDMPAPESKQKKSGEPQVFTTVLHPTELSRHSEMLYLATIPVTDPKARKGSAAKDAMTPGGAATQAPPTPGGTSRAKPVKMLLEEQDFYNFEADYLLATEPPLLLEPAKSATETQQILDMLEHPLHSNPPTSVQTRKRTQADMAADDAQVAREEQRMLILDERVKPSVGVNASAEAQSGTAQLGFTRFKTLETIKQRHEEKERQRKEEEHQAVLAKREHEQEMLRKRKMLEEQRKTAASQQAAQQQQMMMRQQQMAQHKQQQMQMQMQQMNAMAQNPQQQALQQQAAMNHSSPIVRNQTPMMNSSPMVANATMNGGFPMQNSASNQGAAGSPPRPSSAMHHPTGMARQVSQQQHPSRHNTPGMAAATPHVATSMPMGVDRQMSATPRMNHGSPASNMQGTPNANMMNMSTPQMNNHPNLTPQQMMQLRQAQQQRAMMAQQGQMQNQSITQDQIQMRQQQLQIQFQQGAITSQTYQTQMAQLQRMQLQARAQQQASQSHGGEAMTHTASQNPSAGTPTPQPQSQAMNQQQAAAVMAARARSQQQAQIQQQLAAAAQQHGGQVPNQLRQQIIAQNQQQLLAKQQQLAMRAQQAAQQQSQTLGDPNNQEEYMRNLRNQQAMMARMASGQGQQGGGGGQGTPGGQQQGMQGMNMGQQGMQGMGNMGQGGGGGMNMQNMQQMQNMINLAGQQGMGNGQGGMGNMGQGMQGMSMGQQGMGRGMNMQQMQAMQAMRQAQQQQQQQGGGDALSQHFATMQNALNRQHQQGM
ncbi:putative Spt20 family protein [Elsinoe australis]|uniref:Putative Spt20 family protein n=1 Tax=Elsinoe australis TaxID=40998 RepID=A0A4U7B027_9PEZI|nr:putative Spt20 family protein [Elsinoe australis]